MSISDTSSAAREVQLRIHRAMSGEPRILIAIEMSEFARDLTKAGIRERHPEWEAWRVDLEYFRIVFLPNPVPAGLESALRSAELSRVYPRAI
jgi:hypothetical protein